LKRISAFLLTTAAAGLLAGCGSSRGPNDNLLTLRPGQTWVYELAGNVTLPASKGGGTQALQSNSTLTIQVGSGTARDLNNAEVGILDRKIDAFLLDGREVKGNFRLYFSQSTLGIFVHGINDYVGDTASPNNDKFAPSTANPPFKFLYLPNPLLDNQTLGYTDPLSLKSSFPANTDLSYSLQVGAPRQSLSVPAGEFFVKPVSIVENFNRPPGVTISGLVPFSITNGGFDPGVGLVSGIFKATLPDGTQFSGTIALKSTSG
jgi:hypothetical protein